MVPSPSVLKSESPDPAISPGLLDAAASASAPSGTSPSGSPISGSPVPPNSSVLCPAPHAAGAPSNASFVPFNDGPPSARGHSRSASSGVSARPAPVALGPLPTPSVGGNCFFFVVHFQICPLHVIMYYVLPPGDIQDQKFRSIFDRFLSEDDSFRNARLKLIPSIVEGWFRSLPTSCRCAPDSHSSDRSSRVVSHAFILLFSFSVSLISLSFCFAAHWVIQRVIPRKPVIRMFSAFSCSSNLFFSLLFFVTCFTFFSSWHEATTSLFVRAKLC